MTGAPAGKQSPLHPPSPRKVAADSLKCGHDNFTGRMRCSQGNVGCTEGARRAIGSAPEISRSTGDRQLTFTNGLGRVAQSFADVGGFKVGIGLQDFRFGHSFTDHSNHGGNGNAQTANAGDPTHLVGVHGDAHKLFHFTLQPENTPAGPMISSKNRITVYLPSARRARRADLKIGPYISIKRRAQQAAPLRRKGKRGTYPRTRISEKLRMTRPPGTGRPKLICGRKRVKSIMRSSCLRTAGLSGPERIS